MGLTPAQSKPQLRFRKSPREQYEDVSHHVFPEKSEEFRVLFEPPATSKPSRIVDTASGDRDIHCSLISISK